MLCPTCHKPNSKEQTYCSRTCSNKARSTKVTIECAACNRPFTKPPAWLKRVTVHTCSRDCAKKMQERKVIKACAVCSRDFAVRVCEAKKFVTCARKRCRSKRGKRNPNWRGGVDKGRPERSSKRYKAWRKAVFERDDYTCQNKQCRKRGGNLHADHIKPWAYFRELRYVVSNGRTLCVPCHRKTYKGVFKWRGSA